MTAHTSTAASDSSMTVFSLFGVSNYAFDSKEPHPEQDVHKIDQFIQEYEENGMKETVEAVLMVHEHRSPHILVLQQNGAVSKLPGGTLKPGQDPVDGLQSILTQQLGLPDDSPDAWKVGPLLATWWRPNFDAYFYPYTPAHITKPKERKRVFLVQMPPKKKLTVPRNYKLLAIPLFELYDHSQRYGTQLTALPSVLSRFDFKFL